MIERTVRIDGEVRKLGQYDRVEKWKGKVEVAREDDGRIRIGAPSDCIVFAEADLIEAIEDIPGSRDG